MGINWCKCETSHVIFTCLTLGVWWNPRSGEPFQAYVAKLVSGVRSTDNFLSIFSLYLALNIRACYITSHCGRVHSKECYFYIYINFLGIFFFFFSSENLCFHYFHFFLSRNIASVSKSCKLNIFFSFFPFLSFN